MTPDEKALIDAKREGYVLACIDGGYSTETCVRAYRDLAERKYPYPPPPVVWREVIGPQGQRIRRKEGKWEVRGANQWWPVDVTDEYALALARCVTEPTVSAEEVEG